MTDLCDKRLSEEGMPLQGSQIETSSNNEIGNTLTQ